MSGKKVYTDWSAFPANVQFALSEETPRRLIRKAHALGGQPFEDLVVNLLSVPGFSYLRRVMGLMDAVRGYRFEEVEAASAIAATLPKPVTTQLFRHMLQNVRTQDSAPLEGLPLSSETESYMRPAAYFLKEGGEARG